MEDGLKTEDTILTRRLYSRETSFCESMIKDSEVENIKHDIRVGRGGLLSCPFLVSQVLDSTVYRTTSGRSTVDLPLLETLLSGRSNGEFSTVCPSSEEVDVSDDKEWFPY